MINSFVRLNCNFTDIVFGKANMKSHSTSYGIRKSLTDERLCDDPTAVVEPSSHARIYGRPSWSAKKEKKLLLSQKRAEASALYIKGHSK
jgi:hypothetical protein